MSRDPKPRTDESGNIILFPLLSAASWKLPKDRILLALEIAQNEQEFEANEGQTIQVVLTPVQVMELARMLTDAAEAPDPG